jgi:hypothetical protein
LANILERHSVKKAAIPFLVAVCLVMLALAVVLEFRVSRVVDYFGSSPVRALYVLALTAVIGTLGEAVRRVLRRSSPGSQRVAALLAVGATALLFLSVAGFAAFTLRDLAACLVDRYANWRSISGHLNVITVATAIILVLSVAASAWSCSLFCRLLRRRTAVGSCSVGPVQRTARGVNNAIGLRTMLSLVVLLPCVLVSVTCVRINVRGVYVGSGYDRGGDVERYRYGHGWPVCFGYHEEDSVLFHCTRSYLVNPLAAVSEGLFSLMIVSAVALVVPVRVRQLRNGFRFTIGDLVTLMLVTAVLAGILVFETRASYAKDLLTFSELGWFDAGMLLVGIACACDLMLSWIFKRLSSPQPPVLPVANTGQPHDSASWNQPGG